MSHAGCVRRLLPGTRVLRVQPPKPGACGRQTGGAGPDRSPLCRRYMSQSKHAEARELMCSGALLFFSHGQVSGQGGLGLRSGSPPGSAAAPTAAP